MERNSHPPPVSVVIDLVRSASAIKTKPIAGQGGNEIASSEIPKACVIDAHESQRDRHTSFDGNLHLIGRFFWKVIAVLEHAFHHHVNDFVDVLQRFALPRAPG